MALSARDYAPTMVMPLAQALDGAREGFLLIDATARLAASSARMADFFPGLAALLVPGTAVARLLGAALRHGLTRTDTRNLWAIEHTPALLQLRDGRWLRISGTRCGDGNVLATCVDVTDLQARVAALEAAQLDRDIVLDNLVRGVCLYAPDAKVRLVNRQFADVMGLDPSLPRPGATMRAILAASVAAGHHGEHSVDAMEVICLGMIARRKRQRIVMTIATGRLVEFEHIPLEDGGWLATFEDVTDLRLLETQATFLARHDALTGLPNRIVLHERLAQAIASAGRGERFALLCLNLDHFKTINDTLGHGFGDLLLCAVGERLAACARETDLVCRLGGDEFAIVQAAITRAEQSAELARRLVRAFAAPFNVAGHTVAVSLSIGIAIGPDDGARGELLLRRADAAMARAKLDGGSAYRLFERDIDARVHARRTMEMDLRRALAADEFELHFQPLVYLPAGRVTGFEALLRWRHPDGRMVPPGEFIPLAEELGLIVGIGEWVLHAACAAAVGWPVRMCVAVNVSPMQFKASRVADCVAAALAESGLSPGRLELEITESALLADNAATLGVLRGLRANGVRISMDDFGTGYSSLSYLRSFPFDKLKIDQSFVRDLERSPDAAAIVGAVVGLGRSLGMRVTAEGVETDGQLARLCAAGCDEAQGYLFSRPRPAAEVAEMIARVEGQLVV